VSAEDPGQRVRAALVDGEHIRAWSRPDRVAWLVDQSLHLGAVLVSLGVAVAARSGALAWAAILCALALAAVLAAEFWAVCRTRYVLTSHRVLRVSGVLRHDQEYMSWSKITDVSIERSLADRLTQTATIRIHSANERSSFKALADVKRPMELADAITRQVNRRQGAVPVDD
jgi:uncharacterized membrane protein YdbT with pleckstrin-like domain